MGNASLYHDTKTGVLVYPEDWNTTKESLLVDATGYTGKGLAILTAVEDAAQVDTKKLDVSIHAVSSDAETMTTSNLIASFTQIVGSAVDTNATATVVIGQTIELNLDALDPDKPYLQAKLTESSTWEGFVALDVVLGGGRYLPST